MEKSLEKTKTIQRCLGGQIVEVPERHSI